MALTSTQNRISCPCCAFGGDYAFERVSVVSVRTPLTPGVYDELAIMPGKEYKGFKCLSCGYILGLDEEASVQKLARQKVAAIKKK